VEESIQSNTTKSSEQDACDAAVFICPQVVRRNGADAAGGVVFDRLLISAAVFITNGPY
jgi:hypothetical protein